MNFLDESGLNHLWTKIKASFGIAIFDNSQDSQIPFVANHQIVSMKKSSEINVYKWFVNASEGGILEIVFTGAKEGYTYCVSPSNISFMFKMEETSQGPSFKRINFLETAYNTYARLIKINNLTLVVAEFVQNK